MQLYEFLCNCKDYSARLPLDFDYLPKAAHIQAWKIQHQMDMIGHLAMRIFLVLPRLNIITLAGAQMNLSPAVTAVTRKVTS